MRYQAIFFHDANGFNARTHRQWVTAKCCAVVAGLEDVGCFGASNDCANRYTTAQTFSQGHHVRHDTCPLVRKPFAGATHTALHFVNHQEPIVVIAQFTYLLQILNPHRVDTTFALNGFKKHRGDIFIASSCFFKRFNVVLRHANEAFNQWAKASLHFRVARRTQGGDTATVKSFFINDDFGAVNAFVMAIFASQL